MPLEKSITPSSSSFFHSNEPSKKAAESLWNEINERASKSSMETYEENLWASHGNEMQDPSDSLQLMREAFEPKKIDMSSSPSFFNSEEKENGVIRQLLSDISNLPLINIDDISHYDSIELAQPQEKPRVAKIIGVQRKISTLDSILKVGCIIHLEEGGFIMKPQKGLLWHVTNYDSPNETFTAIYEPKGTNLVKKREMEALEMETFRSEIEANKDCSLSVNAQR